MCFAEVARRERELHRINCFLVVEDGVQRFCGRELWRKVMGMCHGILDRWGQMGRELMRVHRRVMMERIGSSRSRAGDVVTRGSWSGSDRNFYLGHNKFHHVKSCHWRDSVWHDGNMGESAEIGEIGWASLKTDLKPDLLLRHTRR